jgi:hypothetical protein
VDYLEAYLRGNEIETWDRLCALDNIRETSHFDAARAVAMEAMFRVRRNVELLIPRWEAAGHRFGYAWASSWAWVAKDVKAAPPLLAQPDDLSRAALSRFEEAKGPLPIVLRAFYEVVGAVNFVGRVANGWPDAEILDPLQVEEFAPQLPALLEWDSQVDICPDHLFKYFVAGVGPMTVRVPAAVFDPVLVFDDGDLELDGTRLTFGRYLRQVILERGGIGLVAGYNNDAPDPSLISMLTQGLEPF